jgi:4-hydroxy-tetrahydrodipicolinate reductase
MNFVILGKGKTGSLVANVARERGHNVRSYDEFDNVHGSALTAENLRGTDVVIDFTAPAAVLENIDACAKAGVNMVVGTTGWYDRIPQIRKTVETAGIGFLYGANFSVGVNLFFEIVRTAATALKLGYQPRIMERHHVQKKDAPSGTAVKLANILKENSGLPEKSIELPIESQREGDTVGLHVVYLDAADSIKLTHDAKSRRGFAQGAILAAEWLKDRKGFYDFKDIWRELA